jgi:hypothetical protein
MTSKRGNRLPTENVADHVSSPVLDACVALPDEAT